MMILASSWADTLITRALNFWGKTVNRIFELLTTRPSELFEGDVWTAIVNLNDSVRYIATSLLVIFFGLAVIHEGMNMSDLKRPETFIKLFLRYFIGKSFIFYSLDILEAVYTIGIGIISNIKSVTEFKSGYGGRSGGTPAEVEAALEQADLLTQIPLTVVALVAVIIIYALTIIVMITVYGRFFKLYIYTALAPIPFSTLAGDITQQHGWQFLKSYIGICLEGAVIALACVIYTKLIQMDSGGIIELLDFGGGTIDGFGTSPLAIVTEYLVNVIFHMLIMLGVIKGSNTLVNEMTRLF